MKKFSLVLSFFVSILNASGQLSAVDYTSPDFAQFKASKTYFVLMGDKKYDDAIREAAKSVWTITSYDFVDPAAFKKEISDKSKSFVAPILIGAEMHGYHYLALFNGGRKKVTSYDYNDMIAYCPINRWVDEQKLTDCYYRISNMLQSMQDAIAQVQKNDIKGSSAGIVSKLGNIYRERSPKIKERTLLFCQESIGRKLDKSDIAGVYPYKFEMCTKEKLTQVINEKSKDYYYYQPGITLNKSMFVIDPSNGECMFFGYSMQGMTISKGNIEDMVKAIDKKK
jgi:hypothetical protein